MRTDHSKSCRFRPSRLAPGQEGRADERGAVLVHVAIALIGLISFSALVVDYGVLWLARRQAQNAADAGAMAGAVSLGFVDFDDKPLARLSAINTAEQNFVFGEIPDITDADVTFPPCPPGSPGEGTDTCIRVDVFRNQRPNGSPLPTFFATLFGVSEQGVKATATAEVMWGTQASCVKPWAIPDKWKENQTAPWDPDDTFERYIQKGPNKGELMQPTTDPNGIADYYEPAGATPSLLSPPDPLGTGWVNGSIASGGDYGRQFVLKPARPNDAISPGWFNPVVVCPCIGGDCYRETIAEPCKCPNPVGPGDLLTIEPGSMIGPTIQGVEALILLDPDAVWGDLDGAGPETKEGIIGGCMGDDGGCNTPNGISPRLVPIPVYDPDEYDSARASGRQEILITKIVGFFIELPQGNDIVGRLMDYPTTPSGGAQPPPGSSFLVSIALVR